MKIKLASVLSKGALIQIFAFLLLATPAVAMAVEPNRGWVPDLTPDKPTPIPSPTLPPYVAPVYVSSTTVLEEGEPWIIKGGRKVYPKAVIHDYYRGYNGAVRIHEKEIERAASPFSDIVVERQFFTQRDLIPGVLDEPFLPGRHPLKQWALVFLKGDKVIKRIDKEYSSPMMAQETAPTRVVVFVKSPGRASTVTLETFRLDGSSEGEIRVSNNHFDISHSFTINGSGSLANFLESGIGDFINLETRKIWNVESSADKNFDPSRFEFTDSGVKIFGIDTVTRQFPIYDFDTDGKMKKVEISK